MYPTLDDIVRRLPETPVTRRFIEKLAVGTVPEHDPSLGPCIVWTRARDSSGYGVFAGGYGVFDGSNRLMTAHRWLFLAMGGVIPDGHQLDHVCHVPELCDIKPARDCPHRVCVVHVVPKPELANRLRSNSQPAKNAVKTRCDGKYSPRDAFGNLIGDDLTDPDNVMITPRGRRECRKCYERRNAAWAARGGRKRANARRYQRNPDQLELV